VEEACFCGTQRHRYDNNLSFDGVWVQCEGCLRWCHGECVGMTAQQAKYADSYTCLVCVEAEGSEEGSAGCSDFASDNESDVDSDGSGLQFRRPDGALNGGGERKEKKQKKEKSRERKEKRQPKELSLKDRQPPSGGKPRTPPAIPVAGGCTKNAMCTRYFRHPGLCKPVEGRPRSISKPRAEARDGPPSSGRAPKQLSTSVSPTQQCHKNKNCPRGYRHPGLCRLSGSGGSSLVESQPEYCQKHPLCLRGHRHPGLCRLAPQPSSNSPDPTPEFCQKSQHCVRRFRHPGLCKLNVEANGGGVLVHEAGGCAGVHPSFAAARRAPEHFLSEHAHARTSSEQRSCASLSHLMFDSPQQYAAEVAAVVTEPFQPHPVSYQPPPPHRPPPPPPHANPYGACNAALAGNAAFATVPYAMMPPGYDAGYAVLPPPPPVHQAWAAAPHAQWPVPSPYSELSPGGTHRPSLKGQQRVP